MPYNTRLEIRLSEQDMKLVREAAWLTKRSLSGWVRRTLILTAEQQIEKGPVKS